MQMAARAFFALVLLCGMMAMATAEAGAVGSGASNPGTELSPANLHLVDTQKELRQLSRNLKLKKNQRVGINDILQERAREIHLLFDVEPLSPEYREHRNHLAAQVMADSNAQIESLLRSKQKQKFDKELIKNQAPR